MASPPNECLPGTPGYVEERCAEEFRELRKKIERLEGIVLQLVCRIGSLEQRLFPAQTFGKRDSEGE